MDYELLQLRTIHEVRALVTQKGMRWERTEKKAELIDRLREIPDPIKPKADEPAPVIVVHTATQQEILELLEDNLKRGLQVRFDDTCWFMRNNRGREDSGSLTAPLSVIKRTANLMTGA